MRLSSRNVEEADQTYMLYQSRGIRSHKVLCSYRTD